MFFDIVFSSLKMLFFILLLFVQNTSTSISFGDYNCSNISPNDKGCNQLAKEGQCENLDSQYCALSCKTCCVDVERHGVSCEDIKQIKSCDIYVEQGYCLRSCNACHRLMEIYALSSLKSFIQYPDQLVTWTGWDPCDNWDGVDCQNNLVSQLRLGTGYFDYNSSVWISTKKIINDASTTIPVQLSCLEDLNSLWVDSIGLTGRLASEFSVFNGLRGVEFAGQSLSGTLPPQYSAWSQISYFSVHTNVFTGTIPSQFSTWINLNYILLQRNKFIGSISSQVSVLSKMIWFEIYENMFTGNLPLQLSAWTQVSNFKACDETGNDICVPNNFYGSSKIVTDCPSC